MLNIRFTSLALVAALFLAGTANAQSSASMAHSHGADAPAPAAASADQAATLTDGEIRKIDKENQTLTIKHGPIKNLDMPSMTMVFGVKDKAMLDQVEPKTKIRFQVEMIDGKYVVTHLEAVR